MTVADGLPDPRSPSAVHGASMAAVSVPGLLRAALDGGDDALVRKALHAFPPEAARAATRALDDLLEHCGPTAADAVVLRYVAFPLIIVAGSRSAVTVPGALPDAGSIVKLLEEHGALGPTRNFGIGNALCAIESFDAISPATLWRAAAGVPDSGLLSALQPAPIAVNPGREQVHLRFLVGAGLMPAHLPSLRESASNVGAWGMPLTRELARQLAQPGLEVLPMPRPPQSLVKAAHAGRCAQLEAALNLFLGNSLRQFRMSVGEPQAVLTSHGLPGGGGELRVSLSSPFDESMLEGFRWPLDPIDDVCEIENVMRGALEDYGVTDTTVIGRVLPEFIGQNMVFVAAGRSAILTQAQ